MRDKIKDANYFEKFISFEKERIEKWDNRVAKVISERGEDESVKKVRASQVRYSYNLLIAEYSSGVPVDEIQESYKKTVGYMVSGWEAEGGYVQIVWILSIGIMLEINDEEFNKLVALVDRDNLQDYVVDYLIASRVKERKISNKLEFDNPYKAILNLTKSGKLEAEKQLKNYLEKDWYKGHGFIDTYWYNNHKSKEDTYFGYWSFESGAIVKIMGLDDSSFKENQYYPSDLVHWKEENK